MDKEIDTVYKVANRMILKLERQEQNDERNAVALAAIRHSTGKDLSEALSVWPLLFESLPTSFLSKLDKPTYEENAIFYMLQIYAVCRQGAVRNVAADSSFNGSLGKSLSAGRNENNTKTMDRRFNAMISADSLNGFVYYLRQLVKQVSAKNSMVINFAKLANDLYWYQKGSKMKICFRWATDYYGYRDESNSVKEESNNE